VSGALDVRPRGIDSNFPVGRAGESSLDPLGHDAGTGLSGRSLGEAQRGSAFVLDPFDAYSAGLVSNPNMIVAGSIGAGKSTVVKMMVDRALARGRRVVVIDPKGEYGELAAAHGVVALALGRDGWCSPFPSSAAPKDRH
jgi:DNA helicase HerA-like ATPase